MVAARRPHRHLPVVRWLQLGVVTAGAGAALVLAPGIAAADDGNPSSSAGDTNSRKTERSAAQSDAGAGPPLTPILSLMGSGMLSYSFPVVSYLG